MIEVNGLVDIDPELIIRGGPDDYFIFNVDGEFKVSGGAMITLDGIESHQVIFNNVTPGFERVTISGGSASNGTHLNVDGQITVSGGSGIGKGTFIAGEKLTLSGGSNFVTLPFGCRVSGPCDCSTLPSFASALEFGAMTFNAGKLEITGGGGFLGGGNLATGDSGGQVVLSGGATTQGYIKHAAGAAISGGAGAAGGVFEVDMTQYVQDILAAAAGFAALPPTQTYPGILNSMTITGNGCINVIAMNGKLNLDDGEILTIEGGPDDYFIFNVNEDIKMAGNSQFVLTGGVDANNLLFQVVAAGKNIEILAGFSGAGTFLDVTGKITADGTGIGNGAYYGHEIKITEGATFYGDPFVCVASACAAATSGVNIARPAVQSSRDSANSDFFYAYHDLATYEGHLEAYRVAPDGAILDQAGNAAVDATTHELVTPHNPHWDAGLELRSDTSRDLYTTQSGSRVVFSTANVSETDLDLLVGEIPDYPNYPASGVDTLGELHTAVVAYVRGKDAFDEDVDGNATEMRSVVLRAIHHSNPLFIGRPTRLHLHEDGYPAFRTTYLQRDRVLYAGANDGMLHAFDAGAFWDGANPSDFDPGTGEELFGYVPGLLLDQLKRMPRFDPSDQRFVDGSLTASDAWLGDGSRSDITKSAEEWATVLVSAFGEGGRGYLALDVTAPGAGSGVPHGPYPKLLWEFSDAKLGMSFSRPVIARVKVRGVTSTGDQCGRDDGDGDCREQWVAIFGGGYETDGDPNHADYVADPSSASWSDRSKAIFMVALDSGQLLGSVEFDAAGSAGPAEMKYSLASAPALLDLDSDGFTDVVYVGDLGGQLWKWDVSDVGEDSDADPQIDNWAAGAFFRSDPQALGGGAYHYRSLYFPPSASFHGSKLQLGFGTGEERDPEYPGDPILDDNNRFYVVTDLYPTGASAFASVTTEADLTDVTALDLYVNPGNSGYYLVAEEGEKFLTDITTFAGYVIAASYKPALVCGAPGTAFLHIFRVNDAAGFFPDASAPPREDRRMAIGAGRPSTPRISMAGDPTDDSIHVNTSEGEVLTIEPPLRSDSVDMIYWRQRF